MARNTTVSLRVPNGDLRRIEESVIEGNAMNSSDWIRDAIKKKIEAEAVSQEEAEA